jgi:hypothetical protein
VLRTRAVFNATELEPGSRLVQADRCSELSDTQGGPAWLGRPTSTNLQALEGWTLRSAGTGARLSAQEMASTLMPDRPRGPARTAR